VTATRHTGPMQLRSIALGFVLALSACAGGGGSTGTGISGLTTAQGNIASAQTARRPAARRSDARTWLARLLESVAPVRIADAVTGVANVTVKIEGTSLATVSDASGSFSLQGDFGGPITLVFEGIDGGVPARLGINVPTGGTLTLTNVRLDDRSGQAFVDARNLSFDGVVAGTNCPGGSLDMVSEATPDDGNRYAVNVQGAILRDSAGAPIQCPDLSTGDVLSVQGLVRDDGGVDCHEADRRRGPGTG